MSSQITKSEQALLYANVLLSIQVDDLNEKVAYLTEQMEAATLYNEMVCAMAQKLDEASKKSNAESDPDVFEEMVPCLNCESLSHPHTMASHWVEDDLIYVCEECQEDDED